MEQNQNEPKMISPGLLTTLIVVILAAAGFFGWNYMQKQKVVTPVVVPTQTADITSSITPSTTPTTTSDISTADWKTYANTTYGYSIKYPSSWFISLEKNATGEDRVYISDKKMSNLNDYTYLDIDVAKYPSETKGTYIESTMNNAKDKIVISGTSGMIEYIHNPSNDSSAPITSSIISVVKNNYAYILWPSYYSIPANNQILDQMVSTFQFTK